MRSKTWIVQSVKNGLSHRPKEHASLSEATTEASRLVTQNPKDTFLIYELVRGVKVQNVVIEDILDLEDSTSRLDQYDHYFDHGAVVGE